MRDLNGVVSGVIAPVKGSGNNERPWSATTVSFDKLFPVFAQVCTSGTSNSGSSILAADIGYTHRVLDNSDDPYTSYLERNTLSITPEFYTESFKSIALLTQGTGTLNVKTISSNSPGAAINFASPNVTGTFNVASSYKSDSRLNGRFVSYRIDDGAATSTSWNLSGIQIEVQDGGTR